MCWICCHKLHFFIPLPFQWMCTSAAYDNKFSTSHWKSCDIKKLNSVIQSSNTVQTWPRHDQLWIFLKFSSKFPNHACMCKSTYMYGYCLMKCSKICCRKCLQIEPQFFCFVTLLQLLWSLLVACDFPEDFPTELIFFLNCPSASIVEKALPERQKDLFTWR